MANMGDTLVDRMHREIEIMTRRLELEKRRLKRLDKELDAAQKTQTIKEQQARERHYARTRNARPKSGGSGAAAARSLHREEGPPMRQLVAQMSSQVKKLDAVKHENDRLKAQVQQIRKYKAQLVFIFERLKSQIRRRSEQLKDFVEEAAQSKAVFSETEQRVEVMQRQREDERKQFTAEMLRIRGDLRKLEGEKREVEVRLQRSEKGVQRKNELILPPEEEEFSEALMMRRIIKTAFLNCIQRRHIKQHQKSIEIFEQAFATIKQSTGISEIGEIVKIFMHLESRNYSLLTYVNHMSREIEGYEGQRRERRDAERNFKKREETTEKTRQLALGDKQKRFRAVESLAEEKREARCEHRDILQKVLPFVAQVATHLDAETQRLRKASKDESSQVPSRPCSELRLDTMLPHLQWFEEVLSRFKDLLPVQDAAEYFPATAAKSVRQLQPKKWNQPTRMVKLQDLPQAPQLMEDPSTQKRTAQKVEVEEDDSEDEGFEDRPFSLKEIRSRAKMAYERKNRTREHKHSTAFIEQETTPSTGLQLFTQDKTTASDLANSRQSVKFSVGAPDSHLSVDTLRLDQVPALTEGGEEGSGDEEQPSDSPKVWSQSTLNLRVRQLIQVAGSDREEVTQDELDVTFLRKYKMSRQELEVLASRMGLGLQHLCFLKTQFDLFDQDQSGYISAGELRELFVGLGEDITEDSLAKAVSELDSDESGEIEFFEFVEWFCLK